MIELTRSMLKNMSLWNIYALLCDVKQRGCEIFEVDRILSYYNMKHEATLFLILACAKTLSATCCDSCAEGAP